MKELKDILFSVFRKYWTVPVEVIAIVTFSQLPLLLATFIDRALKSEKDLESSSFAAGLIARYTANDVFIYATGVLGSAAVFFIFKYNLLRRRPRMFFTGILFPVVVIFLAGLIPTVAALGSSSPNSFIRLYAWTMFAFLLMSWLIALIEQRNAESLHFDSDGKDQQNSMADAARSKIG